MKLQAWARWAAAVAFLASLLECVAYVLVKAPIGGSIDIVAQAAIWTTVLVFALALRPSAAGRPSFRLSPDPAR